MEGAFLWSLVATDVCSGWTEAVPLLAREQSLVVEGLDAIRRQFPAPVLGIDTDNDSVFINETLIAYCSTHQLAFTRSRPSPSGTRAFAWTRTSPAITCRVNTTADSRTNRS
jgi:hypothetical protein